MHSNLSFLALAHAQELFQDVLFKEGVEETSGRLDPVTSGGHEPSAKKRSRCLIPWFVKRDESYAFVFNLITNVTPISLNIGTYSSGVNVRYYPSIKEGSKQVALSLCVCYAFRTAGRTGRPGESDELPRENFIEIAVLHALEVLVFREIE